MTAGKRACPPRPEFINVDPLSVRVFHAIGRVLHLNRLAIARTVSHRGVQRAEACALGLLRDRGGVTQTELAEVLHLSHSRVSVILRTLEESGAVIRRPDESDRRLTRVFLTAEGRKREEEHRAVMGEYIARTIGALSEDERRQLEQLLGRLADRMLDVVREAPWDRELEGKERGVAGAGECPDGQYGDREGDGVENQRGPRI